MMKRLAAVAAAALSLTSTPALAQSAQAAGSAKIIVSELTLSKTTDLNFGTIARPGSGTNTVSVDETTGARSITGGGTAQAVGDGAGRATFLVEYDGGQSFSITAPASVVLARSGGAETISVNLVPSATGGTTSGSSGEPGTATFGVGGNFTISAATVTGLYAGNFTVTVDSN